MKQNTILIAIIIVVTSLFVVQLIISNRLTTMGVELADMKANTEQLIRENELLGQTVASSSSLLVISHRAEELGFLPADVKYLKRSAVAYSK